MQVYSFKMFPIILQRYLILCSPSTYTSRFYAAVTSLNTKELHRYTHKYLTQRAPGIYTTKFITQSNKHFLEKPERTRKLNYATSGPDVDYGSLASTTLDMFDEELDDKKSAFLESLNLSDDNRHCTTNVLLFVAKGMSEKNYSFLGWENLQNERQYCQKRNRNTILVIVFNELNYDEDEKLPFIASSPDCLLGEDAGSEGKEGYFLYCTQLTDEPEVRSQLHVPDTDTTSCDGP
ncbi:hypothetical protein PR048_005175 [Dryococelus australis]|uniref:TLDc domain-containing protein n=1 Tax=Dryococelus australis TaxID=614101 RepID=A0ABQ9I7G4_9NEOP|nr:hypothetical protein PR048_005175 [Dryococelus australis]